MKRTLLATLIFASTSAIAHDIGQDHEHVEGGWNAKAGFVSDIDVKARLWNPRGKSEQEIAARAAYLDLMYNTPRSPEDEAKDIEFRKRFDDVVFVNAVLPAALGVKGFTKEHVVNGLHRNVDAGVDKINGLLHELMSHPNQVHTSVIGVHHFKSKWLELILPTIQHPSGN